MTTDVESYLKPVIAIAKEAGAAILDIYQQDKNVEYRLKADNSPLTEADLIANDLIKNGLLELTPNLPILSEEEANIPYEVRKQWQRYWLVDPLDGTNEFIDHTGQFTINIALIDQQQPVLGVSYAPAIHSCYYAWQGGGAYCEDAYGKTTVLKTHPVKASKVKVLVSRTLGAAELQPFLAKISDYELSYVGGSLKLCLIAEGAFDLYPRLGCNNEWDTAAGQCVVEEAGGAVVDFNFKPLSYNTQDSLELPPFLVMGDPGYWRDLL